MKDKQRKRLTAPPIEGELRLDELMKEAGIKSYQELADKIGIERASLSRSLNNSPTYAMLYNIAQALNVKVYELFKNDTLPKNTIQGVIKLNGDVYTIDGIDDFNQVAKAINQCFFCDEE